MTYWTILDVSGKFSNAWDTPKGIALRGHHAPRVFQSDCSTVEQALEKHIGSAYHPHRLAEPLLDPTEYHPRIHRAGSRSSLQELPNPRNLYGGEMASSLQSARNLFVELRNVFRYVVPSERNQSVYGDKLRSLLILACTEAESALRSVLLANNGAKIDVRLTTSDYVKLLKPMRLAEWRIGLSGFPDYPEVAPFETWNPNKPTESLPWYDAYNKVKHDRERSISKATLHHMLSAMCGVYVMLAGQFGVAPLLGVNPLSSDFVVKAFPVWKISEFYVPALVDGGYGAWRQKPYFESES